MSENPRITMIREKLNLALDPTALEIIDDSHAHVGHPGAASGAGHFTVNITAEAFRNKNKVACHRMIYQALADAIGPEIHALRINTQAPE